MIRGPDAPSCHSSLRRAQADRESIDPEIVLTRVTARILACKL
jgi:hypothetical protein